ncbi:MAG: N-acetylmuramoyl-L-alanine amidase [Ignavibacteriaceae bacterium]|nr:N-acetylmuramoyl-L-alanine amidase [Ignavibacteriaceae bacterium]
MSLKKFLSLFLLFAAVCFSQDDSQIGVELGKETTYIPVYNRQGTIYIPVKLFADVLGVKYTQLKENEKIKFFFPQYNLTVTSKNPYLVLESNEKQSEVVQLPTSTYIIEDQLYIPLAYSLHFLEKALGTTLDYTNAGILSVEGLTSKNVSESNNNKSKKKTGISGLTLDQKANGTLIRLKSEKRIPSYSSSYKEGTLTITFKNTSVDVDKLKRVGGKGVVKEIKARNTGKNAELLVSVTKDYTASEVLNIDNSNDLMITIHNKIFSNTIDNNKNKVKWDFDVIVIDAGHGGKDVGAIGVNGVREKDVNLGVALKLGRLIENNMKNVKVVYTRSNDTFIELYKRGKIANENGGKLFISIHCNSTPQRPTDATGFEVYLLRPGRTQEAIQIATRENSVIQYEDNPKRYAKLTDENFILVSMAHSSYMKYSEKFSDLLNSQFSNNFNSGSRGIKQAGFYVLVGASMPSVLIESGFLTNPKDAAFLKSDNGQSKIAESILNAIKNYREYYQQVMLSE